MFKRRPIIRQPFENLTFMCRKCVTHRWEPIHCMPIACVSVIPTNIKYLPHARRSSTIHRFCVRVRFGPAAALRNLKNHSCPSCCIFPIVLHGVLLVCAAVTKRHPPRAHDFFHHSLFPEAKCSSPLTCLGLYLRRGAAGAIIYPPVVSALENGSNLTNYESTLADSRLERLVQYNTHRHLTTL